MIGDEDLENLVEEDSWEAERRRIIKMALKDSHISLQQLLQEHSRPALKKAERKRIEKQIAEAKRNIRYFSDVLAMLGRKWECRKCGALLGPEWVALFGERCGVTCGGKLREIVNYPMAKQLD